LWREFSRVAERHGAVLYGAPPEIAIDAGDTRVYVTEWPVADDPPSAICTLGDGVAMFVVDVYNLRIADPFLAHVLRGIRAICR
jgi:hypothetical protein